MLNKYSMSDREKCELNEYRGTGLSPRQIKQMKKEALKWLDYLEWLKTL